MTIFNFFYWQVILTLLLKVGESPSGTLQRMVPSPSMSWMIQYEAAKDIGLLAFLKDS